MKDLYFNTSFNTYIRSRSNTMKAKHFLPILFLLSTIACNNSNGNLDSDLINNPNMPGGDKVDLSNLPAITFDTTEHDFGTLTEGDVPEYTFHFTNTGKSNLIISEVHPSCGCTTPDWPKDLIKPGQPGEIHVKFNSKGKSGEFRKSIVVTANTYPNKTILYITGTVYPKN